MPYRFRDLALLIRAPALALLLAALAAGGCAGAWRWDAGRAGSQADPERDRTYEVRAGDTLYSIAWRYGLDYRELAKRNGIGSGYTIYPGQQLNLLGDAAAPPGRAAQTPGSPLSTTPVNVAPVPPRPMSDDFWHWPANGKVVAKFGDPDATGKGIAIGGAVGDPVLASAAGKVVYAGSGLIGYGKTIIVKHSDEYLSAYGHNDTIYVREGEQVRQGDRIASMGRGPGNKPLLHFEIRINGNAVDPLAYLPSR
ncbi:MAG TPA: peptidoglycan DD-metalloendopeptidase family protein [Gammaproteobacteria bacterium]